MTRPKTISLMLIIMLTIIILVGIFRQILNSLDVEKRLEQVAQDVSKLQQQNTDLHKKLTEVQNYDSVEEIARDKLGLAKPNETVIIIQKEAINKVLGAQTKIQEIKLPNWQGWLRLFAH